MKIIYWTGSINQTIHLYFSYLPELSQIKKSIVVQKRVKCKKIVMKFRILLHIVCDTKI
jgi:hypothetical protein